jgi:FkbM family methyltransferase
MHCFLDILYRRIEEAQYAEYRDNYDEYRFGLRQSAGLWDEIKFQGRRVARSCGWFRRKWINVASSHSLAEFMPLASDFNWFYDRLADDESKRLLVEIIAYRMMGLRAVKLPLSTDRYRKERQAVESMSDPDNQAGTDLMGNALVYYDLNSIGYPLSLYMRNPHTHFILEQYSHHAGRVMVEKGDIVLEGGGCYGDTALYFAHRTGAEGQVHSFEFIPSNLAIMKRNLELNPDLESRVVIARYPLWNLTGETVYINENGSASRVSSEKLGGCDSSAETITIDDYMTKHNLPRVDFIKMDIEGAEENALIGARNTICSYSPKMAICLYHSLGDFVRLPRILDQYCPSYKFYIKHATMHAEETVLFAKV